jgi:YHS domain-containing protein
MTDAITLLNRIDQELEGEIQREKATWAERTRAAREREARLAQYEPVVGHILALLRPRSAAFVDRFKDVVKATAEVREHTRALNLEFTSTLAKVSVCFEVLPDSDVRHVRIECTQEIVPVVVQFDRHTRIEFPIEAVNDDAMIQWFDDRVVAFVKTYVALMRKDVDLRDHLKDRLVEDPVAKIRFPKYLASSTLERDGRTYYFVDEETRREFENEPVHK